MLGEEMGPIPPQKKLTCLALVVLNVLCLMMTTQFKTNGCPFAPRGTFSEFPDN